MEVIELRKYPNEFIKLNRGKRKEKWLDCINNHLIVSAYYGEMDKENGDCVFNWTPDNRFEPLMDYLSNNKNLAVLWVKCEGVTSDYWVFKNQNIEKLKNMNVNELIKHLNNQKPVESHTEKESGKFWKVFDE